MRVYKCPRISVYQCPHAPIIETIIGLILAPNCCQVGCLFCTRYARSHTSRSQAPRRPLSAQRFRYESTDLLHSQRLAHIQDAERSKPSIYMRIDNLYIENQVSIRLRDHAAICRIQNAAAVDAHRPCQQGHRTPAAAAASSRGAHRGHPLLHPAPAQQPYPSVGCLLHVRYPLWPPPVASRTPRTRCPSPQLPPPPGVQLQRVARH